MARREPPSEETDFEQQERWHRDERKRKQAQLASDWLHARNPTERPKTVPIQKTTFKVKEGHFGRPLIDLLEGVPSKIETIIVKIPQIPGPKKGATRIPNDFPSLVMAKISYRLDHQRPLTRRLVARDLDLKEDRLQRRLEAANTTYRKLVSLCKERQGVN